MTSNLRYLGLDVHAETIAVALAEPGSEVRSLGTIPNDPAAVAKLIRKLGGRDRLRTLLRSRPLRLRAVLATDQTRRGL